MALLSKTRELLTPAALESLHTIFEAWVSPRSNVEWTSQPTSWLNEDGSENLDATRKASLYLAALALNASCPNKLLELDSKPVHEHVHAWETHWRRYFLHRAVEGIGSEMGSPTYAKYAIQNFINIADLSPNLGNLAGSFLQLWFADAAQAFIPSTGVRGGAHNRAYRTAAFFTAGDPFSSFAWLYGWWSPAQPAGVGGVGSSSGSKVLESLVKVPQMTLFASSDWKPLDVITAVASEASPLTAPFMYTQRRMGDNLPCDQPLGQ